MISSLEGRVASAVASRGKEDCIFIAEHRIYSDKQKEKTNAFSPKISYLSSGIGRGWGVKRLLFLRGLLDHWTSFSYTFLKETTTKMT